MRLAPHRVAKLNRDGQNRLNAIRQSVELLGDSAVLSDEEIFELRQLEAEIQHALNFAFTQSH